MLKIEHFSKKFNGRPILDDVSLSISRGSIAVLLGESGVGKSTLLRTLNNLETLDTGTVSLDGQTLDLKSVNKSHQIGMVFQQFNLFNHLTVEHNITLALELVAHKSSQESKAIAHQVLTHYGLADKAQMAISQLSGGQKQRLALARLIAFKPTVICLDEPTSALDPLLTHFVAQSIQELAQEGYIVLVATHDISLIESLPCTIYLMQKGRVVESAPSQEFMSCQQNFPLIRTFIRGVTD